MVLQNKVGSAIGLGSNNPFRVIDDVNGSVLDSLMMLSIEEDVAEYLVLLLLAHKFVGRSGTRVGFEQIPVAGVIQEELEVLLEVDVNHERDSCEVVFQDFQVLFSVTKILHSFLESILPLVIVVLRLLVHVSYSFYLCFSQSLYFELFQHCS